jgi:hypothetical protein
MTGITRAQIEGAIYGVTGQPDTGTVAAITPALVDAIDQLINPKPEQTNRVIKADETRKAKTDDD